MQFVYTVMFFNLNSMAIFNIKETSYGNDTWMIYLKRQISKFLSIHCRLLSYKSSSVIKAGELRPFHQNKKPDLSSIWWLLLFGKLIDFLCREGRSGEHLGLKETDRPNRLSLRLRRLTQHNALLKPPLPSLWNADSLSEWKVLNSRFGWMNLT